MSDISVSDWVLIASTLFLGALALITPVIADGLKHWWSKPQLKITYVPHPPGAHKTRLDISRPGFHGKQFSIYYFRFAVENTGKSQARRCEAVIEEVWHANERGGLERLRNYGPTAMVWGAGYGNFVDINPTRRYYCDFLAVPEPHAQQALAETYVPLTPYPVDGLGLVISGTIPFYSQPNRLPPGQYRIRVAIFAENTDAVRGSFEIDWPGQWHDDEATMFATCKVRLFASGA